MRLHGTVLLASMLLAMAPAAAQTPTDEPAARRLPVLA